ncbi:MAG TPA: cupin domain-containing protein [Alphaproteobacteria bacterium]|nr:cupin domain-containing protein [Alphaproteobacteria bacterium]
MDEKRLTVESFCLVRSADATTTSPENGLVRRVGAYNHKLLLAEHRMKKGWVGTMHQHAQDQIVYVVSGQLSVTVDRETFIAVPGDSFAVSGGINHQAAALEDSVVVDVFTPCRHDYL